MHDYLKAIIYGILEGITEWLPVSSTGHLLILGRYLKMDVSDEFMKMFDIVIQLGAILAVVILYFEKLNPFSKFKSKHDKMAIWHMWKLIAIAIMPSCVLGILLNDFCEKHFQTPTIIACALIGYGIIFLIIDSYQSAEGPGSTINDLNWKNALGIGICQVLSIIPGTSRSASTIVGGILFGLNRTTSSEFSFYMAIPTIFGYSFIKIAKYYSFSRSISNYEITILLIALFAAFIVSLVVVKWLIQFVRRHSFFFFAVYRLILGAIIIFSI